ncbi:MAG TPA: hypothetical protein VMZ29_14930 [Candidatus Bathyarchaeia archaeon]|nr:hypothetical protein [Candidatus Bathyarchaeia archaeon]
MFDRLLGFRKIQKDMEYKLIQLSFIPSKYFEALYVQCGTEIPCHTLDICEVEEKHIRGELLKLMKEGQVDTKIELEKFQLFERINIVSIKSKEIRLLMDEYLEKMNKKDSQRLIQILKEISIAGKLMHYSMKALYDNYELALENIEELNDTCNRIIDGLFKFKYCEEEGEECEYKFDDPEVLIGNALRAVLHDMMLVGDKIIHIVKEFSYHHDHLKIDDKKEANDEEKADTSKDKRKQKRIEKLNKKNKKQESKVNTD